MSYNSPSQCHGSIKHILVGSRRYLEIVPDGDPVLYSLYGLCQRASWQTFEAGG